MKSKLRTLFGRVPSFVLVAVVAIVAFAIGRFAPRDTREDAGAPLADTDGAATHDHGGEAADEYVCPMHPQIRQSEPGTCPICFMDLVAVATGGGGSESAIALSLSESATALARVRTAPVARVPLERRIHVFGRVATADDGTANITAWTAGRIERLYVETIGEELRRGQRLARVYSPELVVAQETLIHAREILERARRDGSESRAHAAETAAHAALTELRLLGLADDTIEELVADGVADESVIIRAPAGGTVLRRHVSEGDHVDRGAPILDLADLDEVWIQLEIYERDLPHVSPGTAVELRVPGAGGRVLTGEIAFIDPIVDPDRRVARARVVVPNPDGTLRPDMFVEADIVSDELDHRGRPPVSVPASAVLWTGRRSLVYVYDELESPPVYMPIEVDVGDRLGDRVIIESGVFPGEVVAASGAFRLDASLQIRGGNSMMHAEPAGGHDGDH